MWILGGAMTSGNAIFSQVYRIALFRERRNTFGRSRCAGRPNPGQTSVASPSLLSFEWLGSLWWAQASSARLQSLSIWGRAHTPRGRQDLLLHSGFASSNILLVMAAQIVSLNSPAAAGFRRYAALLHHSPWLRGSRKLCCCRNFIMLMCGDQF